MQPCTWKKFVDTTFRSSYSCLVVVLMDWKMEGKKWQKFWGPGGDFGGKLVLFFKKKFVYVDSCLWVSSDD
jgi:hypothetical protein